MCGIFSVINHPNALELTKYGLLNLRHRGEDGSGIAVLNTSEDRYDKGTIYVDHKKNPEDISFGSKYNNCLGHNRYRTSGDISIKNIQPILLYQFALTHNGEIDKTPFQKYHANVADSRIIAEEMYHVFKDNRHPSTLFDIQKKFRGAFALCVLTEQWLICIQDNLGIRPLNIGKKDGAFVVSSETCAMNSIGAEYIKALRPGEIWAVNLLDCHIYDRYPLNDLSQHCIFEHIYFARPDSNVFDYSVYDFRKKSGALLAKLFPVEADIVVPVPDSGNIVALGYSEESNIKLEYSLIKNNYQTRSFIKSTHELRQDTINLKLNVVPHLIKDKNIVLVDDSIVRGNTLKNLISKIRSFGPKTIHARISSPLFKYKCVYGINTPTNEELIASSLDKSQICEYIGSDSLEFLPLDSFEEIINLNNYCKACFDGKYPV